MNRGGDRNVSKLRERHDAENREAAEVILRSAEEFSTLQVEWARAVLERLGKEKVQRDRVW